MTVTTRDPLLGAVLESRYRLDAVIARGGMSTVYRASDLRLERTVAVKVMDPALAADPAFKDRFGREARSIAQVNHRNVAAVYDQGDDDGNIFLAMEYVPGRTLRQVLRETGPLSPGQALPVIESTLAGLSAAHRKGFVHRDIKPENILVADDGTVRVVDFGLARAIETTTITQTGAPLLGTVAYLAPEQIASGVSDPRSDVYAAGIVLFEMLTGIPPFEGDTAAHVAYRHVHEDVPGLVAVLGRGAGIPEPLDDLVRRATARDPGRRPIDAGAFLSEVRTVAADCRIEPQDLPVARVREDLPTESVVVSPFPREPGTGSSARHGSGPSAGDDSATDSAGVGDLEPRGALGRRGRRRRGRRRLLVALVIMALAVLATAGWWFSGYTTTPELVGMSQDDAAATAEQAGFTTAIDGEVFSETVEAGLVAETDPGPGSRIREGATVALAVSKGKERYTIPDLRGHSRAAAEQTLAGLTLVVAGAEEAYDDEVPGGSVVTTRPEPGTEMRRADEVTLVISKGPAPVELPDLTAKTAVEAATFLTGAGLKVAQEEEYSDTVKAGVVIRHDPGPGTTYRGQQVTLIVSKGPEIVTVPNLSGMTYDEAATKLQDLGLKARKAVDVPGGSSRVIQQQPGAGAKVEHGSSVSLFVF